MRNERAALAVANERILASPRMSPRLSPRLGPISGGLLPGALSGAGGLRRSSSWSGGLGLSPRIGGQSPRVVPVPVPVPVASPRIGGYGGGYGGLRSRTPSPSRLVLSPRIGARTPSPRVVNYNTFNVSPRLRGLDGVPGGYGGVGGLGALDDLHLGGRTPIVDPIVLGDGGYDGGLFGGGAMPGQITTHHHHDFVVTDLDHEPGRAIGTFFLPIFVPSQRISRLCDWPAMMFRLTSTPSSRSARPRRRRRPVGHGRLPLGRRQTQSRHRQSYSQRAVAGSERSLAGRDGRGRRRADLGAWEGGGVVVGVGST